MTYQAHNTPTMPTEAGQQNQQNRRGGMSTGFLNAQVAPTPHDIAMHAQQATGGATVANNMPDNNMASLMNQFGAINMAGGSNVAHPGSGMHSLSPTTFISGPDGNLMFATPYNGPVHPMIADHGFAAPTYPIQYGAPGFGGAYATGTVMPFTPGRAVSYSGDRVPHEIPGLENRRGSYSTSATESTPATPFFGSASDRVHGTRVVDQSAYTTPSPRDAGSQYVPGNGQIKVKPDPAMEALLIQEPPIPKAVPAVWTDHIKPLEQCLENRILGNKNVYIRGLHPTTDDELLLKYAERFGEVEQSKAIIDTATGACKGFGFAKFKLVEDSERCIRGFYHRGYEVGFARESFNARLKAEGDKTSTNLYISNLPKDVNESMLIHIFEPFRIVSSKILRDSAGNSRGVGFARFETRDICEKVIRAFHGLAIGKDHFLMQVRYADTPAQKELKRITAERRQYRTNEYNIGAYGTHAVGMNPSIYNAAVYRRNPVPSAYNATFIRSVINNGGSVQGALRDQQDDANTPDTASANDGSGDEGVTIVDNPIVANGSSQSSPSVKKEKP